MTRAIQLGVMILFFVFTLPCCTYGQDAPKRTNRPYKTWVKKTYPAAKTMGFLLYLEDSVIVLRDQSSLVNMDFPITDIEYLQFRERGKATWGIVIGGISGLAIGAVIGASLAPEPSTTGIGGVIEDLAVTSGYAFLGGLVGMPLGGAVGASIASPKTTIHLYGNPAMYEQVRGELVRYTLKF